MSLLDKLVVLVVTSLSLGSVACVVGETRYETIEYDPHTAVAGLVCKSPMVKADLSTLKKCKGGSDKSTGKGHCYPRLRTGVDEKSAEQFKDSTCADDEICYPDKILEANGAELKKCTFKIGTPQEGRCMANLAKQMADNWDLMKKDDTECDPDEACSPCINPIDKSDTKICQPVGVFESNCSEGGAKGQKVELCCAGLGLCMDKSAAPEGAGDSLPKDSCKKDAQICAPANLIDSKAEKCSSIGGADGVCLPICFADMVKGAQAGLRSSCNALSFCLPCAAAKLSGFDMPGCE